MTMPARWKCDWIPAACVVLWLAGCGAPGGAAPGNDAGGAAASGDGAIERSQEKGPVKLFVRVTPHEPRLSDLVEMDVKVEFLPDVEIKPPAFGDAVGDFLIRDYNEPPARVDEPQVRRFHYQLEPAHAGRHLIRSVAIEFVDNRPDAEGRGQPALIETDPIEVNVTSELGEQAPDLANLEPMLPPEPLPGPAWTRWWPMALGCIAVLAAAIAWARRRRLRRTVEPPRRTPEEIAQAALLALLAEDLPARGLFKEFYLRLTGIVRQYIEDTTGLRAPEQTTEEFLRDMRSRDDFPAARAVRLAEFLEAADMVKYAGQQPGEGQVEEAVGRAREFVAPVPLPGIPQQRTEHQPVEQKEFSRR